MPLPKPTPGGNMYVDDLQAGHRAGTSTLGTHSCPHFIHFIGSLTYLGTHAQVWLTHSSGCSLVHRLTPATPFVWHSQRLWFHSSALARSIDLAHSLGLDFSPLSWFTPTYWCSHLSRFTPTSWHSHCLLVHSLASVRSVIPVHSRFLVLPVTLVHSAILVLADSMVSLQSHGARNKLVHSSIVVLAIMMVHSRTLVLADNLVHSNGMDALTFIGSLPTNGARFQHG